MYQANTKDSIFIIKLFVLQIIADILCVENEVFNMKFLQLTNYQTAWQTSQTNKLDKLTLELLV